VRNSAAAFVKIGFCGLDFPPCRVRELTLGGNRRDIQLHRNRQEQLANDR
jgi:hypothetical protein